MALVPVNLGDRAKLGAQQFYRGFTPGQKAVTLVAVVAAVAGGVFLMKYAGKPTYTPLFTNLSASDAASITTKLTSDKVPYQLANGGTTVMVPANDVNQERISLAQSGLPAGSNVGLSLLDKVGITSSNVTQQADYIRALQGELEQTIDSITGVSAAQVNIAMPANQSFSLNNDAPTGASVLVDMQAGQTLGPGTVQAIVHLVASSVPNLDSSTVTVADSAGNLLAGPGVVASAGASSAAQSYDTAVQSKVQTYLASIVGAGNADVQVSSSIDTTKRSTTNNQLIVGKNGQPVGFCTSTSASKETYTGAGAPTGGTAGAVISTGTNGTGNYSNTQNSQTCETSESTQTIEQDPGTIQSQQVAVLVNSSAIPPGVNMTALKAGVAAAAGITPSRGDTLAFSSMPFNTTSAKSAAAAAKAAAAATQSKAMSSLIRTAVIFLFIGLVMFFLWRSARKARANPTVLTPAEVEALRASRELGPVPTVVGSSVGELTRSSETKAINAFIDNQPDDVAAMLRGWLQETPSKAGA